MNQISEKLYFLQDELQDIIDNNPDFEPLTLAEIRNAREYCQITEIYLNNIHKLIHNDLTEERFHIKLRDDLNKARLYISGPIDNNDTEGSRSVIFKGPEVTD